MGDFTITSRVLSQSIPATAQEKCSLATSSRMLLRGVFAKSTFLRPGENIKQSTLRISARRALSWFIAGPSRRSSTVGIAGDKYVWHRRPDPSSWVLKPIGAIRELKLYTRIEATHGET